MLYTNCRRQRIGEWVQRRARADWNRRNGLALNVAGAVVFGAAICFGLWVALS